MSEFENEQTPAETASEAPPAESIETTPEPAAAPAPEPVSAAVEAEPAPAVESAPAPSGEAANTPSVEAASEESGSLQAKSAAAPAESRPAQGPRPPRKEGEGKPRGERPPRPERGERPKGGERQDKGGDRPKTGERREGGGERREGGGGERRDDRSRGRDARPGPRDHGRPFGRPDLPIDIELEKLLADSLYLDNQAHAVVSRIRDMDAGTRSQVRRLFSAVRRACRAAETDRQHQFVMLRARLAYTIARHQLRSLDPLERLLLQVTRKNDPRAYERFRDLFEAIVAYNE
jgi:CRISPR type III-A-associated protein Csm2